MDLKKKIHLQKAGKVFSLERLKRTKNENVVSCSGGGGGGDGYFLEPHNICLTGSQKKNEYIESLAVTRM